MLAVWFVPIGGKTLAIRGKEAETLHVPPVELPASNAASCLRMGDQEVLS